VVDDRRDATRKPRDGVELRVRIGGERARLEPVLRLSANDSRPSSVSSVIGSSSGSSRRAIESACESVFPASANAGGSRIPYRSDRRCRSASASHLRNDESRIAVGERADRLGVVGLFLEVQLAS
jgi:hypothetical protein